MLACRDIDKYWNRNYDECEPDDIHAFTSYRRGSGTHWDSETYKRPGFQLYYAHRLFARRMETAHEALNKYLDNVKAGTKVVSIGCGPGAELAAAYEVLKCNQDVSKIGFLGIDCESGWKKLYEVWTKRMPRSQFNWRTKKVGNERSLGKLLKAENASVVIVSYFLLDFGNGLNMRGLMRLVPELQQVIILDNPNILIYENEESSDESEESSDESEESLTKEKIDSVGYRAHSMNSCDKKSPVQVLMYSRREIDSRVNQRGFALMLRPAGARSYELSIYAGDFKPVQRDIAQFRSSYHVLLVRFHAINGEFTVDDMVNLVAPRLARKLKVSEKKAHKVITDWCTSRGDDEDDYDSDWQPNLIEELLEVLEVPGFSESSLIRL